MPDLAAVDATREAIATLRERGDPVTREAVAAITGHAHHTAVACLKALDLYLPARSVRGKSITIRKAIHREVQRDVAAGPKRAFKAKTEASLEDWRAIAGKRLHPASFTTRKV